ncbi:MAG: hypothetical protein ACR2RL_21725 [Gammaproteobacteria bacterium]
MAGRVPSQRLPGYRHVRGDYAPRPGEMLALDTRLGVFTLFLPVSARDGDRIALAEPFGFNSLAARPVTVRSAVAGRRIDNNAGDWSLDVDQAMLDLVFDLTDNNWLSVHPNGALAGAGGGMGSGLVDTVNGQTGTVNLGLGSLIDVAVGPYNDGASIAWSTANSRWEPTTGIVGGTF